MKLTFQAIMNHAPHTPDRPGEVVWSVLVVLHGHPLSQPDGGVWVSRPGGRSILPPMCVYFVL